MVSFVLNITLVDMGDYLTSNLLPRKIGHYPATPADVGFSYSPGNVSDSNSVLLAHLSQRLIGELIGYPWSGVRPSSVVVRRPS